MAVALVVLLFFLLAAEIPFNCLDNHIRWVILRLLIEHVDGAISNEIVVLVFTRVVDAVLRCLRLLQYAIAPAELQVGQQLFLQ